MKRYEEDDFFADTRMSFGDHLEELRACLLRALYGFLVGLFASFFFGHYVVEFIAKPVEDALIRYYNERASNFLAELEKHPDMALNQPVPMSLYIPARSWFDAARQAGLPGLDNVPPPAEDAAPIVLSVQMKDPGRFAWAMQQLHFRLGPRPSLKTLSATEAFLVWFMVCAITGLVLTSPWVFYQIWTFVAAGLYPHEKRFVHIYLPFSLSLFLGGVLISEFLIIPFALDALLYFNRWMGMEPDFRLNEWLGFAILVPVLAGICFQTPLVMLFLAKVGVFLPDQYVSGWKYAAFGMLILAALGPTIDPGSLILLWGCMVFLYLLGVGLSKWLVKPDLEVAESEEIWKGSEAVSVSQNGQQGT
jgi:sec-independent protein translocase protein TatC